MDTAPSTELEQLQSYLAALPPQRLVLRSVDEFRPEAQPGSHGVNFGRKVFVEVVTVQQGQRTSRVFQGVAKAQALEAAREHGHDVIERNGNLT